MNNRILVLGATGNIGGFLVQNLRKKKADFVAGVPSSETRKLRDMGIEARALDFGDPASLDAAMNGVDSLFMLLPIEEQILDWADNIVSAARRNDVGFILRSSLIDASPDSRYSLFKIHGEADQMVRASGIPYAIVHPNSFMQNFAVYYAGSINEHDAFYFTYEDERISYIDVRDIAAVDAQILLDHMGHHGREYSVTGPKALTNDEIADILSDATGKVIKYIPVKEPQYEDSLRRAGASDFDVEMYMSIEKHIKDGKQSIVTGDVQAIIGRPPIPFEQFARDYAETWRKVPAGV